MKKIFALGCLTILFFNIQSFKTSSTKLSSFLFNETASYITNNNFEQEMLGWNDWNNGLTSIPSQVHAGTYAGKINRTGNGSLQRGGIYLKSNTNYEIKFWARSEFNGQKASLQVVNETTNYKHLNNNSVNLSTTYSPFSFSFSTNSDINTVFISLFKWNQAIGEIFADDFEIVEIGNTPDQIRLINTNTLADMFEGLSYQAKTVKIPLTAFSKELWEIIDGTGSATVTQNGLITAVSNGTVTLKVSYVDTPSIFDEIQLSISPAQSTNVYYVDASGGNDLNDGLLESNPWKTLAKVNSFPFLPGDNVLFKSGETWTEKLILTRKGVFSNPITYTSYGTGDKPKIAPTCVTHSVELKNASYTIFEGFDVSNNCNSKAGDRYGIAIFADNEGEISGIEVKNNEVHNVAGHPIKSKGISGGIVFGNKGETLSRLVDLKITGNHIYDCERNGINGSTYWTNPYRNLRVYVAQNVIERVPGDGIVMKGTLNSICEYNICRDFTSNLPDVDGNAAAGIWPFNSVNCTIQYNEVSGHKASWDGQGFDSDWRCEGTIIQYNYSHDNAGGFILICSNGYDGSNNSQNKNPIVRYNISINDGYRTWGSGANFSPTFHIAGPTLNTQIYNNTIFYKTKPASVDEEFVHSTNWNGWSNQTHFKNNLFVSTDSQNSTFKHRQSTNNNYTNNLYFGNVTIPSEETNALNSDPLFVNPGLDNSTNDYKLKKGSLAIGAGVVIENNGGLDFFGNTVSSTTTPTIGAFEYQTSLAVNDYIHEKDILFSISGSNIVENEISFQVNKNLNETTVKIISLTGQIVFAKKYNSLHKNKQQIALSSVRKGLYFLELNNTNQRQVLKFIKK
ncbi:carbohydrate binding domain-containing protein [Polaribacter atrinae]|uniref:carbohydrate binding domain-containing protein n=1 Tax=Polaribacter atrinae TaxID=1333662 RepID=UPI00249113B3|nr:carbohydrate binding domain-containing protein [Polaribacter atrinae]